MTEAERKVTIRTSRVCKMDRDSQQQCNVPHSSTWRCPRLQCRRPVAARRPRCRCHPKCRGGESASNQRAEEKCWMSCTHLCIIAGCYASRHLLDCFNTSICGKKTSRQERMLKSPMTMDEKSVKKWKRVWMREEEEFARWRTKTGNGNELWERALARLVPSALGRFPTSPLGIERPHLVISRRIWPFGYSFVW